jgi:hypothetical protein
MPNFCTLAVYLHLENIHQGIYSLVTGVYTAYAVTLAMEKSLEDKKTLSQDGK